MYPYNGFLFSSERNEVLIHAKTWMNLKSSGEIVRMVDAFCVLKGRIPVAAEEGQEISELFFCFNSFSSKFVC